MICITIENKISCVIKKQFHILNITILLHLQFCLLYFFYLGTLVMLDHPHEKSQYQCVGNFHAYMHAKTNFITLFFLKILYKNSKLVILGNLGMPGHKHLKLVEE